MLPAQDVAAKLLQSPAQLSLVCSNLQECFAFNQAAAGLLLYATPDSGPHLATQSAQPLAESPQGAEGSIVPSSETAQADFSAAENRQVAVPDRGRMNPGQGSLSAPLLPRMPAGLAHVGTQQGYKALAAVARGIGRVALESGLPCCSNKALSHTQAVILQRAWAQGLACCNVIIRTALDACMMLGTNVRDDLLLCAGGLMLRGLVDALLSSLRRVQRQGTERDRGQSTKRQRPAQDWRLQAASISVAVTEVFFGASPACQPGTRPAPTEEEPGTAGTDGQRDELEALVIIVEMEWVKEPLWGVPTTTEGAWQQGDAQAQLLNPQACTSHCFGCAQTRTGMTSLAW